MRTAYARSVTRRALDAAALRLVHAIDIEGSVTGAARRLGITQPAASQQLRALERLLGTPAVVRRGRGVQLTDAGAVLSRHAQGVESALDAAVEEVAAVASLRAGRVRLAAFPSASATILPVALALLDAGRCDIAVTFRAPHSVPAAGRQRTALLQDELVVVGAPSVRGDAPVALASLAAEPWIAGCPQCRSRLLDSCLQAGFEPRVDFATDDYVTVLALVAAGFGVASLPALALRAAGDRAVRARRVAGGTTRLVEAVTTPSLGRVPAVRAALAALDDAARGLVDGLLIRPPDPDQPTRPRASTMPAREVGTTSRDPHDLQGGAHAGTTA